jgi:nucleoside-diphosphate-sugar epimerase
MRVAVTGGAGFLGSHLTNRLLDAGEDVAVIGDFSTGSRENLSDLGAEPEIVAGDLKDPKFTRRSLEGMDKVYHFAADIGNVAYLHGSESREQSALRNNLAIDSNVIRACIENRIGTIIYASSVSVYPKSEQMGQKVAFREEDSERVVDPEGGYGWAKYIAERQLAVLPDIKVGVARIFHAYGPNIYLKEDRSQVIGSLIRKAIRYPKEDFVVWGDGTQRRAFLYVDDFLDGLFRLDDYVETKGNLTVNLGSTEETTIKALAETIIGISGKRITPKYDTTEPVGVLRRLPDLSRAEKVLGWKPKTKLADGLAKTYEWAERRIATWS